MLGTTPRHVGIAIGEALQALALDRRKPSHTALIRSPSEKRLLLRSRESRTHVTLHQCTFATTSRSLTNPASREAQTSTQPPSHHAYPCQQP